jgi:hypothetical protein
MEASTTPLIKDPKYALAYMLQPRKNTITFRSTTTGTHFTFQIKPLDKAQAKEKGTKDVRFFVKFLCGQDNENDYRYLGQILNGVFSLTTKSRQSGLSEETPAYKAFKFAFDCFAKNHMPTTLEVVPSGRCARCGRKLTVVDSVTQGFGPECINMVGGAIAPQPLPVIDTKAAAQVQRQVKATGVAAPQRNLNFTDVKTVRGGVRMYGTPGTGSTIAKAAKTILNVGDMDTEIRRRINEYKAEAPENYYQDGMLDEQEAFNVAYNMFRVKIQGGN